MNNKFEKSKEKEATHLMALFFGLIKQQNRHSH